MTCFPSSASQAPGCWRGSDHNSKEGDGPARRPGCPSPADGQTIIVRCCCRRPPAQPHSASIVGRRADPVSTPADTADPVERTRSGSPSDGGNRVVTRRFVVVRMAVGAGLGVRRGNPDRGRRRAAGQGRRRLARPDCDLIPPADDRQARHGTGPSCDRTGAGSWPASGSVCDQAASKQPPSPAARPPQPGVSHAPSTRSPPRPARHPRAGHGLLREQRGQHERRSDGRHRSTWQRRQVAGRASRGGGSAARRPALRRPDRLGQRHGPGRIGGSGPYDGPGELARRTRAAGHPLPGRARHGQPGPAHPAPAARRRAQRGGRARQGIRPAGPGQGRHRPDRRREQSARHPAG